MRTDPSCVPFPFRILTGLLGLALIAPGCSPTRSPEAALTGPVVGTKDAARPSLKERRTRYIEKLQGTTAPN